MLAIAGLGSKTVIVSDASGVGAATWSWVVVHQAIGMTMEYLDCSGLAALEALIAQAGATGQNVSDFSTDVVERCFRFHALSGQ
jgi:isopentenyl diphosphate isomerase/L-lactate dehydrogenase-like FMN-dependent dehydrogenase